MAADSSERFVLLNRPAFDEQERNKLIKQATTTELPRGRSSVWFG